MLVKLTNTESSAVRNRKNKQKSFISVFSENRVEFIIYGAFVVFLIYTAVSLISQHNDIDRKMLSRIVFSDSVALLDLNGITHRFISKKIAEILEDYAF